MKAVVDIHAHVYEWFGVPDWPQQALANLRAAARRAGEADGGGAAVLCVTGTAGAGWRQVLEAQAGRLGDAGWTLEEWEEGALYLKAPEGGEGLFLLPARQIATYEGLEILELLNVSDLPEGHAIDYLLNAIPEKGGLAVLPWSPGKWTFRRGRIIRNLIDTYSPGKFLLASSSLLPSPSPAPALLRLARSAGYTIVAGSDPLPVKGEEAYLGCWATLASDGFDPGRPVSSLREVLRGDRRRLRLVGKRPGWMRVAARLGRLRRVRGRRTGVRPSAAGDDQ